MRLYQIPLFAIFHLHPITFGCDIQESLGLQFVLAQMIIRTQQSAIVNVQLFQKEAFVQVTQCGMVAKYNRLQLKGTMWDL